VLILLSLIILCLYTGGGLHQFIPAIIIALAMFFASNISSKAKSGNCLAGFDHDTKLSKLPHLIFWRRK
jgi:hypothetical protein